MDILKKEIQLFIKDMLRLSITHKSIEARSLAIELKKLLKLNDENLIKKVRYMLGTAERNI